MEHKTNEDLWEVFSAYLTEKNLRRTQERRVILQEVCAFDGHFSMDMLRLRMNDTRYHVSRATLYNTLEVLIEAKILVKHPPNFNRTVQYELRSRAETHIHLICTRCDAIREVRYSSLLMPNLRSVKSNFAAEYSTIYIYGICGRCRNKEQRIAQKQKK
ncbi:MAG: transcriptional repressor [Tannerellaceae bacterium]|nr:transcriptional repressor [Tannerellaceae bacterium]